MKDRIKEARLPWNERVTMLQVNPEAATLSDIVRLAALVHETEERVRYREKNVGEFLIWRIVCISCGTEWHGTSDNKDAWCRCICANCDGDTFQVQFKNKLRQQEKGK